MGKRLQSLAMGTQERGDAAVVTCSGKRRGGGSHSQWAGTRERDELAAVIPSGQAQGERREERSVLLVGERGGDPGGMKQNNYQPV